MFTLCAFRIDCFLALCSPGVLTAHGAMCADTSSCSQSILRISNLFKTHRHTRAHPHTQTNLQFGWRYLTRPAHIEIPHRERRRRRHGIKYMAILQISSSRGSVEIVSEILRQNWALALARRSAFYRLAKAEDRIKYVVKWVVDFLSFGTVCAVRGGVFRMSAHAHRHTNWRPSAGERRERLKQMSPITLTTHWKSASVFLWAGCDDAGLGAICTYFVSSIMSYVWSLSRKEVTADIRWFLYYPHPPPVYFAI